MATQEKTPLTQINLDLLPEIYETLNNLMQQINSDMLLKAMALLEVAVKAKQKGKNI